MAATYLKGGSYKNSGTVYLDYELYAEQIGASGNSRTIRITANFKCGGNPSYPSYWGYAMTWRPYANSTYGSWASVKGTETWNTNSGWVSRSQDITVDVGTTSATTVTVGFSTDSSGDNGWDGGASASFSVGSTNTAPWFQAVDYLTFKQNDANGSVITAAQSGTENATKVPETLSKIYISWPTAYDNENNPLTYEVWWQSNESSWSLLADTGSNRYYTHTIGTGNEGRSYDYDVRAKDTSGAYSGWCTGTQFQKNTFTMDSFSSSSAITYDRTDLTFNFSGGSNTQSGVTISRRITCDNGITINNNTVTTSPITVKINYGQANGTVGPYINWTDIVAKYGNDTAKGIGTLTFTLTSTNSNGTAKTALVTTSVNIQTPPNGVGVGTGYGISLVQSESTNYRSTTVNSNAKYFIPNGALVTRVKWTAGSGKVGDGVKYKLYVSYGGAGWEYITDLPSGTTYYDHAVPKQTESKSFNYLIRAVSTFNDTMYTDVSCTAQTMHYYNDPGFAQDTLVRASTTADIGVVITSITSIPNVQVKGSWTCKTTGGTAVGGTTNLATTPGLQILKVTGLADSGSYIVTVSYNDNSGLMTTNKTATVEISANAPVFFINKFGVGVGGEQANQYSSLVVNGGVATNGLIDCGSILSGSVTATQNFKVAMGTGTPSIDVKAGAAAFNKTADAADTLDVNYLGWFRRYVTFQDDIEIRGAIRNSSTYEDGKGYYHHTNGIFIKTTIQKTVNTMFELYITGNSYGTQYPIDISLNGYVYNGDIINRSSYCAAYNVPIQTFFTSDGYLGFWFIQASNYSTFRFKLCGGGSSTVKYTVADQALPTGITNKYEFYNWQGYNEKNSIVVIETAENSNGKYIRFSDGTQICWKNITQGISNLNAWGQVWESYGFSLGNWAASFKSGTTPTVAVQCGQSTFFAWPTTCHSTTTTSVGSTSLCRPTNVTNVTATLMIMGIGVWR